MVCLMQLCARGATELQVHSLTPAKAAR